MASEKTSDNRTRSWTFIVYPDSAPENWQSIIDDLHIEWYESPLHEFDINPTGELKKAHWHVVINFEGKKSFEQIKSITDLIHATIPQPCHSIRGAVRYMAHLDNPEKYQYPISGIIGHGPADVSEMLRPSSSSRYALIGEMVSYVRENNISEFKDLVDYALDTHSDDWFPLLCDNSAFIMREYIKSHHFGDR